MIHINGDLLDVQNRTRESIQPFFINSHRFMYLFFGILGIWDKYTFHFLDSSIWMAFAKCFKEWFFILLNLVNFFSVFWLLFALTNPSPNLRFVLYCRAIIDQWWWGWIPDRITSLITAFSFHRNDFDFGNPCIWFSCQLYGQW